MKIIRSSAACLNSFEAWIVPSLNPLMHPYAIIKVLYECFETRGKLPAGVYSAIGIQLKGG